MVTASTQAQSVSQLRAMVGAADGGDRGDDFRSDGRHITGGKGSLAVADKVDPLGPGLPAHIVDLLEQLIAPGFIAVGGRNNWSEDAGTTLIECLLDAIEVVM